MNRTASDTIAAVIQVLIFFLEDSLIFLCVRILINIIGNESGDKSNVTYNWGPQKGVRKAADSQKRGWQSKKFVNLCSGLTALFLLLLAKAALAYLPTVLSMSILHAFCWFRQHQHVCFFSSHFLLFDSRSVLATLSSPPCFLFPKALW